MGWLVIAGGYLLGCLLPAEWFVRRRTGRTPHELDDNPGSAGAWRLAGPLAGVAVALFDIAKGLAPVAVAESIGLRDRWLAAAAVAPVAGHNWPFYKGFRGGRGLGPATGALFWLAWRQMLPAYLLGALAAWKRRWAPMVGVVAFPVALTLMVLGQVPAERLRAAVLVMLTVAVRQVPWVLSQPRLLLERLGLR